jgi:superfamily II DNA or RNA helicase
MDLRPYQEDALAAIKAGFNPPNNFRRQLAVMPTASGKTILFSKLAEYVARRNQRTLILAHREELLEQAKEKLRACTGIEASIEAADRRASLEAPVVIASIQSMTREERLARWPETHFKLVVADEAHHAISPSWQKVLTHFGAYTLGVTATPDRGDKRLLADYFESIAYETTLIDLIKEGYLARIRVKTIPVRINMDGVKVVAGDYSADDIGAAIELTWAKSRRSWRVTMRIARASPSCRLSRRARLSSKPAVKPACVPSMWTERARPTTGKAF